MNKVYKIATFLLISLAFIACSNNDLNVEESLVTNEVERNEILDLVNEVRAKGATCGEDYYPPVEPVIWNLKLEKAALKHSEDMVNNDFFSHVSSNGESLKDRLDNVGYLYTSYSENIAYGYPTAESVINGWLNSEGHCTNLMSSKVTEMGVGRIGNHWTQNFGKPSK